MNLLTILYNIITIKPLFDPLEQFDILILTNNFGINLNNLVIFAFFLIIFICLIHYTIKSEINNEDKISAFKFMRMEFFKFVDSITNANTLLPKHFFLIIFYFYFLFILWANFIGLIPFSYTITSSFIVTFSLSLFLFLVINFIGIYRMGFFPYLGLFIPSGTPIQITFLLVIIEIVSYIARLFSLSIRLFANMMAGHTLLKILIGFGYSMLISFTGLIPFAFIPWFLVTIIFVLEILISFLQAYVSIILIRIYTNDVIVSH